MPLECTHLDAANFYVQSFFSFHLWDTIIDIIKYKPSSIKKRVSCTVGTSYLEIGFLEFPDISKWNSSPKLSCSYFHMNTKVWNPSTSVKSNFDKHVLSSKLRHILFNQPNDSSLWVSHSYFTPLTYVRTLNAAYCLLIVLKRSVRTPRPILYLHQASSVLTCSHTTKFWTRPNWKHLQITN